MAETEAIPLKVVRTTTPTTGAARDIYSSGRSGRLAYHQQTQAEKQASISSATRQKEIDKLQADVNRQREIYESDVKKYNVQKDLYEKEHGSYQDKFKITKEEESKIKSQFIKQEPKTVEVVGVSAENILNGERAFRSYTSQEQQIINREESRLQMSLSPEQKSELLASHKLQTQKSALDLIGVSREDILSKDKQKTQYQNLFQGEFRPGVTIDQNIDQKLNPTRLILDLSNRSKWQELYYASLRKGDEYITKAQEENNILKSVGYGGLAIGSYVYNIVPSTVTLGQDVWNFGLGAIKKTVSTTKNVKEQLGIEMSMPERFVKDNVISGLDQLQIKEEEYIYPPQQRTQIQQIRSGLTQSFALMLTPQIANNLYDDYVKTMTGGAGDIIKKPKYITEMKYINKNGKEYLVQNIKTSQPNIIQSSYLNSNPEGFISYQGKNVPYSTISMSSRDVSQIINRPELLKIKGATANLIAPGKGPLSTELWGKTYSIGSKGKTTLYNTYGQSFTYDYDSKKLITHLKDIKLSKNMDVSLMRDLAGRKYEVYSTTVPTDKLLIGGPKLKSALETQRYYYVKTPDYQSIGFLKTPVETKSAFAYSSGSGLDRIPKDLSKTNLLPSPGLPKPAQVIFDDAKIINSQIPSKTFKGLNISWSDVSQTPNVSNIGRQAIQSTKQEQDIASTQILKMEEPTLESKKVQEQILKIEENIFEPSTTKISDSKTNIKNGFTLSQKTNGQTLKMKTPTFKKVSDLSMLNKQSFSQKSKLKFINRNLSKSKLAQKLAFENITKNTHDLKLNSDNLVKQNINNIQSSDIIQQTQQSQSQRQILANQNILDKQYISQPANLTKNIQPTIQSTNIVNLINTRTYTYPRISRDIDESKERVEVKKDIPYETYVREKGRWNKIDIDNKKRNKYAAMALGAKVADDTVARSWKIKKGRGTTVDIKRRTKPILRKFYRMSKTQDPELAGAWIEKSAHAIDSPGEMKGITAKGWEKQQKKKFVKNYLGGSRKPNRKPKKTNKQSIKIKPPKIKSVI